MTQPNPIFSPDAEADVVHAAGHYNSERPNLGYGFLDEVEHAASLIRETPLLFTLVDAPVRRALLRRFPYGVFYLPGTPGEPSVIVAVVDPRQDPEVIRHAYSR